MSRSGLLTNNEKYKVNSQLVKFEPAADTRDYNMRSMDSRSTVKGCCIVLAAFMLVPLLIGGVYMGVSMGGFISHPAYCNYTTDQVAALVKSGSMSAATGTECVCAQASFFANLGR